MIKILPHERPDILSKYTQIIHETETIRNTGRVERIIGLTIESIGPGRAVWRCLPYRDIR